MNSFKINNTEIGKRNSAYIVAEMSANHCGCLETALQTIRKAKECGANAIKIQTYTPDTITLDCNKSDFCIPGDNPWNKSQTLYALYKEAYTPWEWHEKLFEEAKRVGIDIFSAPFDESSVDFLETLGCPAYKIASPEITHIPLIEKVGKTGKPVIISTGVAEFEDIKLAVETLRSSGCKAFALLKCTSSYPAPLESINLLTIPDLASTFGCIPGISDHSLGTGVSVGAVVLGASIVEKHFIIDKKV